MYVSRATRAAISKRDQEELSAEARRAEAHFAGMVVAWEHMRKDSHVLALLSLHGIPPLAFDCSARSASDDSRDGVTALELVVLEALATRVLSKADLVGWLARHHAGALAAIQAVCDARAEAMPTHPRP